MNDFLWIKENLKKVEDRIQNAITLSGRNREEVTLIAVSKTTTAEAAYAAFKEGVLDFGENRVDELKSKLKYFRDSGADVNMHMIGNLQSRKIKDLSGNSCMIHSVDRIEILDAINDRALLNNICENILFEVNLGEESSKHGFDAKNAYEVLLPLIYGSRAGIKIRGLMTMAPFTEDNKVIENVFACAFELFSKLKAEATCKDFNIISMGMSNDYELAIKHGSTHIRVGSAIFGHI